MINSIMIMEINQPIGSFYVGKIDSSVLIQISKVIRRSNNSGTQRELQENRVKEIAKYCEDPDATFPTPVVISIKSDEIELEEMSIKGIFEMKFDGENEIAEILDGQHRLEGIKKSKDFNTELMIAIMFDLTEEEKAYVFSTINSNQKKVDKSLIYDLFDVSENRSPYKTCHEIARIMNSSKSSPFYNRLKMLGKKNGEMELLSQGTFVTYLLRLISNTPQEDTIDIKNNKKIKENRKLVFRDYFSEGKDNIILKILLNYFDAVKEVFEKEWNSGSYILTKTTGYGALIKALPAFYEVGREASDLSKDFFKSKFMIAKENMTNENIELTSQYLGSGEQAQNKLANIFKSTV